MSEKTVIPPTAKLVIEPRPGGACRLIMSNDAVMNGLSLDIHAEEKAVELFAENIMKAGEAFLDRPMERPFIPSWSRVISAIPDVLERLSDAVEADHAEFSAG